MTVVRAEDQYHVGIVVDDLDATLVELTEVLGYVWAQEMGGPTTMRFPDGDRSVPVRFAYSKTTPRLEIIQSIPGTLWVPADSGVHHLGYWSDDVAADTAQLVERGYELEVEGVRPDGRSYWSYVRRPGRPRVEIVTRDLEPVLRPYWS